VRGADRVRLSVLRMVGSVGRSNVSVLAADHRLQLLVGQAVNGSEMYA